MKKLAILTFAAALLSFLSLASQAQQDARKYMKLETTAAGATIEAQGVAMQEGGPNNGQFAVRAFAQCPEGATFVVTLETRRGDFDVGVMRMYLGSGFFRMDLGGAGELDMGEILGVVVTYEKEKILEGRFNS